MRIPRHEWPQLIRETTHILEVHVGQCWEDATWLGSYGCAHVHASKGVLCVANRRMLRVRNLLIHEVAHMYADATCAHGDSWRRHVVRLGGHLDAVKTQRDSHKRTRAGKHSSRCPCRTERPELVRKWGRRLHYGHGTSRIRID